MEKNKKNNSNEKIKNASFSMSAFKKTKKPKSNNSEKIASEFLIYKNQDEKTLEFEVNISEKVKQKIKESDDVELKENISKEKERLDLIKSKILNKSENEIKKSNIDYESEGLVKPGSKSKIEKNKDQRGKNDKLDISKKRKMLFEAFNVEDTLELEGMYDPSEDLERLKNGGHLKEESNLDKEEVVEHEEAKELNNEEATLETQSEAIDNSIDERTVDKNIYEEVIYKKNENDHLELENNQELDSNNLEHKEKTEEFNFNLNIKVEEEAEIEEDTSKLNQEEFLIQEEMLVKSNVEEFNQEQQELEKEELSSGEENYLYRNVTKEDLSDSDIFDDEIVGVDNLYDEHQVETRNIEESSNNSRDIEEEVLEEKSIDLSVDEKQIVEEKDIQNNKIEEDRENESEDFLEQNLQQVKENPQEDIINPEEEIIEEDNLRTREHLNAYVSMEDNDRKSVNEEEAIEEIDDFVNSIEEKENNHYKIDEPFNQENLNETNEGEYVFPEISLLNKNMNSQYDLNLQVEHSREVAQTLNDLFKNFKVGAKVISFQMGPIVTIYEISLEPGTKISKLKNLEDNIKLALGVKDIRMQTPIIGKTLVGIDVPNKQKRLVSFRDVYYGSKYANSDLNFDYKKGVNIYFGQDAYGQPLYFDLTKAPHLLVAGSTGSGKSVAMNSILASILMDNSPEKVKLLLIDPKMVEFTPFHAMPHLITPIITDTTKVNFALELVIEEMEKRYKLMSEKFVRNIGEYNDKFPNNKLPYIVVVIEELADLMITSSKVIEQSIIRITQKARAAGIHMIIATQRPSVDIITGLIKANVPSRVAFTVASNVDSRTILDQTGAEKLIGEGDMLISLYGKVPIRAQGAYISSKEIDNITDFVREKNSNYKTKFNFDIEEYIQNKEG